MTTPDDGPSARWADGAATGVGSMPGTDAVEAAATVAGELPLLPHLPELPERGVGADPVGRAAGLLVDLAVELVPSAYRVTPRAGREHRRAVDLLRADLDALDAACENTRPEWVKLQVLGPWSLAAAVELRAGHRVLTDRGAVREFAASLGEGLRAHVAEVAARTGARPVVQLDEPTLPAVLAGTLPTASGFGTVAAVPAPDVASGLRELVALLGVPVVLRCAVDAPPVRLLAGTGAAAIGIDATRPAFAGATARTAALDALGEVWDAGTPLLLGLVPATGPAGGDGVDLRGDGAAGGPGTRAPTAGSAGQGDPVEPGPGPSLRALARIAFDLADRLGFDRSRLARLAVPTPTAGLAGATPAWARRALALSRDLGRAFADPPEGW